ncbi:MAG: HD domain-containing phosphohydrolase [Humidesulfovibrio sp.]|uniref:HD-GYP domain-containing protein n=1 Tax=Humidesulfovibrio sp. TaxID=2910988 RepID=UPI0027EE3DE0|nr:HD domain-containing phosphohydrolase [Humidesulfovibrio sp.]MDQ7836393.1 HD domain-containing phosphohydrolase [Humidesulfovibrio sp.]
MRHFDAPELLRSFFRRSFWLTLCFAALLAVALPLLRHAQAIAEYKQDSLAIARKFLAKELDFDLRDMLARKNDPLIERINIFMDYSNLVEFRIWDRSARVVYSFADPLVVGKRFPDDHELLETLTTGQPSTEIDEADKLENHNLREYGTLLEMYVPVISGGRIVGAVELYRKVPPLGILNTQNLIYALGALLLPLLLHVFFYGQFKLASLKLVHSGVQLQQAYSSLVKTSLDSIRSMVNALEMRDTETQEHSEQVVAMAVLIGHQMGLSTDDMARLVIGAYLHDVGKIGVPDAILLKPGPLNAAERAIMETHVTKGRDIVEGVEFLCLGADVVHYHHERWDGTGYATGLAGENIPLTARIFALVDVFDALMSKRPYKEPFTFKQSREIIRQGSGTHFDPRVVDVFLSLSERELNDLRAEVQRKGIHDLVRQVTGAIFGTPKTNMCDLKD